MSIAQNPNDRSAQNWTADQHEWRSQHRVAAFGKKNDWKLYLQQAKTDPQRVRILASHSPDDVGVEYNDTFVCEVYDAATFVMAKGGNILPGKLPQDILQAARGLAASYRDVALSSAAAAANETRVETEATLIAEAGAAMASSDERSPSRVEKLLADRANAAAERAR